jgi:hypothetical protein
MSKAINQLNENDQARRLYRDELVLSLLSTDFGTSVNDIGCSNGTARASLNRLVDQGRATREWDGNGWFGRYLYRTVKA